MNSLRGQNRSNIGAKDRWKKMAFAFDFSFMI